jgi:trimethylamine--corrinoid protein Co-methyltransferase
VTDETLSYDVIRDTVFGTGHFLNQPQTLELMQSEFLYPDVADRRTPGDWEASGKEDIYELAHRKVKKTLSEHYPKYINAKADERIRSQFPIKINYADMNPGNGRW